MKKHFRLSIVVVMSIVFWCAATVRSQSSDNNQSYKLMKQTPEAREVVLQKAQAAGTDIEVTIDLAVPLTNGVLENFVLNGQLQSVLVVSTDSDWQVTIYSTPESPITSLSQALANAQQLHGGIDTATMLGVQGFTFRGSPASALRARDILPNATFAAVSDLSELAKLGDIRPPASSEAKGSAKKGEQSSTFAVTSEEAFEPNNVELKIQTLSNSDRKMDVTFSWNGSSDLSALMKDRATLEIQVLFWNHAKNTKEKNFTYVGRIKSVSTNFNTRSYTYIDTQALNGAGIAGKPEEREVAVGSYNARADFQAGKQYTVSVITERGLLSANLAKLSFQLGIYEPRPWEGAEIAAYCAQQRIAGNHDPANCVKGKRTFIVTPKNSIGSTYSIMAPTVPSFKYPTRNCDIPAGYPQLTQGKGLDTINESAAQGLATQALLFQRTFERSGGKNSMGCPTNSVHMDTSWWPRRGVIQDFDGNGKSAIMLAPGASQAYWVHGGIWSRYVGLGGPKSLMGEPKGDEQAITSSRKTKGAYQAFERGWFYYHGPKNRVFYVVNAIADKYKSLGMHTDQLGLPISDEYPFQGGARNDFEGGYIHWTPAKGAVVVRNTGNSAPVKPTIQSYSLKKTPRGNEPFDGTIKGTGFVPNSTKLYFCLTGSRNCYPHPQNGITVKSSGQLEFKNVRLTSGAWEMFLETSAGQSAHSKSFAVLMGPPTISRYNWSSTPKANKNFSGYVEATELVPQRTEVWFCINGKKTCYPHPKNGITIVNTTRVNVKNVRLTKGKWQVVLRTPNGQSGPSSAFTVK